MDALFREQQAGRTQLLGAQKLRARGGRLRGRACTRRAATTGPQADCIMFTRDRVPFCAVCRRALSSGDRPLRG